MNMRELFPTSLKPLGMALGKVGAAPTFTDAVLAGIQLSAMKAATASVGGRVG